jgi:hypothetical protein
MFSATILFDLCKLSSNVSYVTINAVWLVVMLEQETSLFQISFLLVVGTESKCFRRCCIHAVIAVSDEGRFCGFGDVVHGRITEVIEVTHDSLAVPKAMHDHITGPGSPANDPVSGSTALAQFSLVTNAPRNTTLA